MNNITFMYLFWTFNFTGDPPKKTKTKQTNKQTNKKNPNNNNCKDLDVKDI